MAGRQGLDKRTTAISHATFPDDPQDIVQWNDSPPGSEQQQDDAEQGQISEEWHDIQNSCLLKNF
jgi:hypothetical protein